MDGGHELAGLDAREHRDRKLRADPADRDQPFEDLLLERREKSVQLERVLADVGVDPKRDLRARFTGVVERAEGHADMVANALDINDKQIGLFVEDPAAEECNHPLAGGRYWRQERGAPPSRLAGAPSGRRRPAPTIEDGGTECK